MDLLVTERLRLRHLTVHDAPFILELLNTPSWLTYIGDRGVRTLDDARNYMLHGPMSSYERHGFGLYRVALQDTDTPIGLCGLIQRETLDKPDIGFAFLPNHTGKGYGFEAASAVLAHELATLGIDTVAAIVTPDNYPSIRLIEKLGLRFQKRFRLINDSDELLLFEGPVVPQDDKKLR